MVKEKIFLRCFLISFQVVLVCHNSREKVTFIREPENEMLNRELIKYLRSYVKSTGEISAPVFIRENILLNSQKMF